MISHRLIGDVGVSISDGLDDGVLAKPRPTVVNKTHLQAVLLIRANLSELTRWELLDSTSPNSAQINFGPT